MKVCYFIQTHKNPEQIYRLIRKIKQSSPDTIILIGHDSTNFYLDLQAIENLPEIYLLARQYRSFRGDFSLLKPYLDAIDWLWEKKIHFDWLIYLSGQDYPITNPTQIHKFLANTDYDGLIEYWDVLDVRSPWGKGRAWKRYYCQYYRFPENMKSLLQIFSTAIKILKLQKIIPIQFFLTYGSLVGLPAKVTPFNQYFKCYGGFQWHTLSRKCVEYLRDFIRDQPDLVKYYQQTVVADESFVQTILVNSNKFNLYNSSKRYFDTHEQPGGHARNLTIKDYQMLVDGDYHFARKFDLESDSEILDKLDLYLFSKLETKTLRE